MRITNRLRIAVLLATATLAGCSYNPMVQTNRTTGSAFSTAVGTGVGGGLMAYMQSSKALLGAGALTGGMLGYYSSTLRYQAGGVMHIGGKVYMIGDYIGIYIPTDQVFYPNTPDLTPNGKNVLSSVITVLNRKPDNNIMISGNTSGFDRPSRELKLSTERAKVISAYLWSQGINDLTKDGQEKVRKLNYVGYGDYFPVASNRVAKGLRQNSRIQITSYPRSENLAANNKTVLYNNIGALQDDAKLVEKDKYKDLWKRCDENLQGRGCYTGTEALQDS